VSARARCGLAALWLLGAAGFAGAQQASPPAVTVTFYGTIVANAGASSAQFAVPDIPLWALVGPLTPPPIGGQPPGVAVDAESGSFELTARQSRFGARVAVPAGKTRWTAGGQVEVDFLGARPAAGQGTVFNQLRLRIAIMTLRHESGWSLGAGQDWVLFAPVNPASLAHFAIPLAASGGNPWMRLPQVRVERAVVTGDTTVLVQGALLRPVGGGDLPLAGTLADSPSLAGERSGQPFYQARLAVSRRPQAGGTIGVSAHYGREDAETNTVSSWGVALDGTWRVHPRLTASGELWTGANLDTFQAGIAQGLALRDGRFHAIDARGGWLQLAATLPHDWTVSGGFAQDDPSDDDLTAAVTRARNRVLFLGTTYKPHPNVTIALQHNYFDTVYRSGPGAATREANGHHLNLAFAFAF
jgi:hypothetical protein